MKARSSKQMVVLSRQTAKAQLYHKKYESYDMVLLLSTLHNFKWREQLNNTVKFFSFYYCS